MNSLIIVTILIAVTGFLVMSCLNKQVTEDEEVRILSYCRKMLLTRAKKAEIMSKSRSMFNLKRAESVNEESLVLVSDEGKSNNMIVKFEFDHGDAKSFTIYYPAKAL